MSHADTLLSHHLADLRKSGLSDDQIAECGFKSSTDPVQIGKWLKWKGPAKKLGPCLVIPFHGLRGDETGYVRMKPDMPRVSKKPGKAIKYESPKGAANRAYFPPHTRHALADSSVPVLITEGEKKAAKADQEGFACIGLVGVYGFQRPRPKDANGKGQGPRELIADLAAIPWRGRRVFIAFDSDLSEKSGVQWAEYHLAETLQQVGASVSAIRIPAAADGSKQGLDDFLVSAGPEALRELMVTAKPVERPDAEPGPRDAADNPHRLAGLYVESLCKHGPLKLRFWRNEFAEWSEVGAYATIPDADIKARLTAFIRDEFCRLNLWEQETNSEESQTPKTRHVTTRLLADVLNALRSICLLPATVTAPAWIDGTTGPDPSQLISTKAGILDVAAYCEGKPDHTIASTPELFTFNSLPFGFDPKAPQPTHWLNFLHQLWPSDPDTIDALREWFGYLLTADTRQQKILFLLGPRRAGKGTIARVLKELVGSLNVAGPTLNGLTMNFGLSPLLEKTVAIIDDARLSHRSDAAVVTERLLTISGEGTIGVDRKHLPMIHVKLPTRFVIISNELPRLGDASGALAGRLIVLRFTRTFFGREDHTLTERLLPELPGILLWALAGWKRLHARGRFVQPATGAELVEEMEDLASPVGAFVREECVQESDATIPKDELYRSYCRWCETHGRKEPGTQSTFGRDLRAAVPGLGSTRPGRGGERRRDYTGIRLRLPGEDQGHQTKPEEASSCNHHGPLGPLGPWTSQLHALPKNQSESQRNQTENTIRKSMDQVDHRGPRQNQTGRLFADWRDQMLPD